MIHRGSTAKFVPSHVGRDMFIERRQLAVAPVFVEDIELQDATLDLEIVQCRHGVGVVTSSADHSTKLVANLANDEVLLGRTYAKTEPDSDNIFLRQRRLPRARLNVARPRSSHALLVDGHGGNGRSL